MGSENFRGIFLKIAAFCSKGLKHLKDRILLKVKKKSQGHGNWDPEGLLLVA